MKSAFGLAAWMVLVVVAAPSFGQAGKDAEPKKKIDTKKGEKKVEKKIGTKEEKKTEPESLDVSGVLNRSDPTDTVRTGAYCKIHMLPMRAGLTYVIELHDVGGTGMDPYLRLEDSSGKRLAEDDDGAGALNSRIVFTPPTGDTYRLIATTLGSGRVGTYRLTAHVVPPGWTPPAPRGTPGFVPSSARPIFLPPGTPAPTEFDDIIVRPLPHLGHAADGEEPTHGYMEFRFLIENRSETQPHEVEVVMPRTRSNPHFPGHHLRSLRKAVTVSPGTTVEVSLFQPDIAMISSGDLQITIDGRVQERGVAVGHNRMRGVRHRGGRYGYGYATKTVAVGISNEAAPILTSWKLTEPLFQNVYKSAVGQPAHRGMGSPRGVRSGTYTVAGPEYGKHYMYPEMHQFVQGPDPLSSWSKHWLGYSTFAGVTVGAKELQDAPADVRRALWQYVECGGALVIVGDCKVPEGWERSATQTEDFQVYHPGFGQCLVASEDVTRWGPAAWRVVTTAWEQSSKRWGDVRAPNDANRAFPVVQDIGIPVRGMFLFMFAFVVLIGPVNFIWLNRVRRRIWLLWTVPLLSFLTCLVLFGYMVVSEGWHGHVRAEGITVLDEVNGRAATVGWLGYYSPTTPGGGLRFDAETELTPHVQAEHHRHDSRGGTPCTIDWSVDQHLDTGWLTAKVPAHFMIRRNEKRLERILVRKQGDTPTALVNSLNADIKKIWVAATDGTMYSADNVVAGTEAALAPVQEKGTAEGEAAALREGFGGDWLAFAKSLESSPGNFLRPGCYVAILEDSPFLEQGLRRTQSRKMKSIVYGIMKE